MSNPGVEIVIVIIKCTYIALLDGLGRIAKNFKVACVTKSNGNISLK